MTPPGPSRVTGIVIVVASPVAGFVTVSVNVVFPFRSMFATMLPFASIDAGWPFTDTFRPAVELPLLLPVTVTIPLARLTGPIVIGCGESAVAAVAKSNPTAQPISATA